MHSGGQASLTRSVRDIALLARTTRWSPRSSDRFGDLASGSSHSPIGSVCNRVRGGEAERAARHFVENSASAVAYKRAEDACAAVKREDVDFAVLPIESSTLGSIHAHYDLLLKYGLHVVGEYDQQQQQQQQQREPVPEDASAYTRFLLLSKKEDLALDDKKTAGVDFKTSLVFGFKDSTARDREPPLGRPSAAAAWREGGGHPQVQVPLLRRRAGPPHGRQHGGGHAAAQRDVRLRARPGFVRDSAERGGPDGGRADAQDRPPRDRHQHLHGRQVPAEPHVPEGDGCQDRADPRPDQANGGRGQAGVVAVRGRARLQPTRARAESWRQGHDRGQHQVRAHEGPGGAARPHLDVPGEGQGAQVRPGHGGARVERRAAVRVPGAVHGVPSRSEGDHPDALLAQLPGDRQARVRGAHSSAHDARGELLDQPGGAGEDADGAPRRQGHHLVQPEQPVRHAAQPRAPGADRGRAAQAAVPPRRGRLGRDLRAAAVPGRGRAGAQARELRDAAGHVRAHAAGERLLQGARHDRHARGLPGRTKVLHRPVHAAAGAADVVPKHGGPGGCSGGADNLDTKRQYIVKRLTAMPNVRFAYPTSAFYVFLDLSSYFKGKKAFTADKSVTLASVDDFCAHLLQSSHVAVVPGSEFGDEFGMRISYASSMEAIAHAMDGMENLLKSLTFDSYLQPGQHSFSIPRKVWRHQKEHRRRVSTLSLYMHTGGPGFQGFYRLFALDEYTRGTSLSRVLLVCIGTPMPTVALVLIQASVPLQDPSAGWRENYGFWVRVGIVTFAIAILVSDQSRFLIDGVVISRPRQVLLSLCASGMFIVCSATISVHFMFPVPFFAITMGPVFYPLLAISYRLAVGRRVFRHILQRWDQFARFFMFVCIQVSVGTIYPAYEALFRYAEGSRYQTVVILLLPILKVVAKNNVLRCMTHMEDLVSEAVIFTVDFFNAIYIATCMQSATSTFAVTATDLSQTAIMLYGLHKRTLTTMLRLRVVIGNAQINDDLAKTLTLLCRTPEKFNIQLRADVRVNSCFPHALSRDNKNNLDKLANLSGTKHTRSSPTRDLTILAANPLTFRQLEMFCATNWIGAMCQVVPEPAAKTQRTFNQGASKQIDSHRAQSSARRSNVLRETLEVLFSMECLVATAYLEAAVPFFYSCYIVIMVFFPSAQYHSELVGITSDNMGSKVRVLLLFGLLQVFSFVVLVLMIKRNCGMQAWYHLAFVLDTQMPLIQGKLIVWVALTSRSVFITKTGARNDPESETAHSKIYINDRGYANTPKQW
ncbi:hypothetical protein ON010_g13569 [Phytophthora cinnamomi]|nr:hypothetical protein ON010_g13569 [Phytophthora cinnamomi]